MRPIGNAISGPDVGDVIAAFGGCSRLSKALGHRHSTTVRGWMEAARIPSWRVGEIVSAAEREQVTLPLFNPEEPERSPTMAKKPCGKGGRKK